jgi:hypothetical protein
MCWVLYLAADRPLTERLFDPESPAFNVASVSGNETSVRKQFSKAFVYALGAHTGCGCGFDREQANADHPEELAAAEVSLEALRRYLGTHSRAPARSSSSRAGMVIRSRRRIIAGNGGLPISRPR